MDDAPVDRLSPSSSREKVMQDPQGGNAPNTINTSTTLRQQNLDALVARLSLSYLPSTLPCRQHLTDQLTNSIKDMLLNQTSGTSYLSGMPGTGKSVVLRWVLGYLHSLSNSASNQTYFFDETYPEESLGNPGDGMEDDDWENEMENNLQEERNNGDHVGVEEHFDHIHNVETKTEVEGDLRTTNPRGRALNKGRFDEEEIKDADSDGDYEFRPAEEPPMKASSSKKKRSQNLYKESTHLETGQGSSNLVDGSGMLSSLSNQLPTFQSSYSAPEGVIPPFETIWINALKLSSPTDAFSRIWDCMEKYTERPNKRMESQKLSNIFYGSKIVDRPYMIVVIDELDYLITKSHNVIYELFNWPQQANSRIIVIGIANTIDIRAKLPHKVASRIKETECIVFQPYNHFELEEILVQRLGDLKDQFFDDDAIAYLCHRVASSSGDIRQLFAYTIHVLQRKTSSFSYNTKKRQRRNRASNLITRDQVASALDEFVDEYPPLDLPLYDQLFLICTLLEESNFDQNVQFERVVVRCQTVLRKSGTGTFIPSIQMWWSVYERLIGMQAIRENTTRSIKSNFPVFYLYGYASYQVEQLLELDALKPFRDFLVPGFS